MEDRERADLNKFKRGIHPKEKANLLSNLFFCWQLPIFLKGLKKDLTEEDLCGVLKQHESKRLGDALENAWHTEEHYRKNPSLLRALIKVFGLEFMIYGIVYFPVRLLLSTCQPLLLKKLLDYYSPQQTEITKEEAYLYASLIVLLAFLHVLAYRFCNFALSTLGMKIRVACCSLIYRKSLKLHKSNFGQTSVGQLVNLLSNDVNRFDTVFQNLHYLWITPVEIIVVMYILDVTFGHAAIAGVGILIFYLLLQLCLSKKISTYRMKVALKSDNRIRLINEIISSMQVIKMYMWEKPFSQLIELARTLEIDKITSVTRLFMFNICWKIFLSKIILFMCILVAVLTGLPLTPQYIFVVTSFYEGLKLSTATFLSRGLATAAETKISVFRIQNFLMDEHRRNQKETKLCIVKKKQLDPVEIKCVTKIQQNLCDQVIGIYAKDVSVKWNPSSANYTLNSVSFNLCPGELIAFVGAAGSGKSTILQAVMKEIPILKGSLDVVGTLSYASQEPWIFSGSIKQNILFGLEMDKCRYSRVIRVCALEHDISLFPFGDRTIVGERGVMLSGGQKARINLARAIYRDADIYLLDDPLSAVDTHVAKQLFDKCISDYLKNKCTMLVTHQVQYLKKVKKIVLLEMGRIVAHGTYRELNDLSDGYFLKLTEQETEEEKFDNSVGSEMFSLKESTMPTEVKEHRTSNIKRKNLYINYITASGNWIRIFTLAFLFIIEQFVGTGMDYFVTFWINLDQDRNQDALVINKYNNKSGTTVDICGQGLKEFFTVDNFLYIYSSLLVIVIVMILVRCWIFIVFCMDASKNLHNKMFAKIIFGPMSFFNFHPSGRILNRFSKDIGSIDELLPTALMDIHYIFLNLIAVTTLISILNYWILIPTTVLFIAFYYFAIVFTATNRSVKRTEGTTRSPVFSHLTASLQGVTIIRAFNAQSVLQLEFDKHQDVHSSVYYIYIALHSTLSFWVDITCTVYIGLVTFSFFLIENETYVGNIGLAVVQTTVLTGMIPFGIRTWSEVDNYMTSVERVVEYSELPQENDNGIEQPPELWPTAEDIEFRSVSMKYCPDGPLVLNQISFEIKSGEKVGIVGRTGAGKSSLISALFRLFDFEGQIIINGVDIKRIPLKELRSKISIIPQDPILFTESLRKNLDPFDEYDDLQIWNALEEVELKNTVASLPSGLETAVLDGGSNFSVGQKQLLCLVRAIVRCNKILVLDEATANIDFKTDELVQATIRRKFKYCTILTIAHRLHTVMDSDKILVMDSGRAMEFDHPYRLLQNPDGIFYGYVNQNGNEMAEDLMKIAKNNFNLHSHDLK